MSQHAATEALRYYAAAGRSFAADVQALAANPQALVLICPQLVVLMKPADSRKPQDWEQLGETPAAPDAWYVHLLVGDLRLARRLARLLPAYPWVCFQRGKRSAAPHCLPWARLSARSQSHTE